MAKQKKKKKGKQPGSPRHTTPLAYPLDDQKAVLQTCNNQLETSPTALTFSDAVNANATGRVPTRKKEFYRTVGGGLASTGGGVGAVVMLFIALSIMATVAGQLEVTALTGLHLPFRLVVALLVGIACWGLAGCVLPRMATIVGKAMMLPTIILFAAGIVAAFSGWVLPWQVQGFYLVQDRFFWHSPTLFLLALIMGATISGPVFLATMIAYRVLVQQLGLVIPTQMPGKSVDSQPVLATGWISFNSSTRMRGAACVMVGLLAILSGLSSLLTPAQWHMSAALPLFCSALLLALVTPALVAANR